MNYTWIRPGRVEIAGTSFVMCLGASPGRDDEQYVFKSVDLVERYLDIIERERPRRIVELGIHEGGSTAMLLAVAEPERLLALDIRPDEPPSLRRFIDDHPLGDRLIAHFGMDQGDREAVSRALDEAFGDEPIDLVFDDASHILGPTRSSFEMIFPRLRPGGLYILEDWNSEQLARHRLAQILPPDDPSFADHLASFLDLCRALGDTEHPRRAEALAWTRQAVARHLGDDPRAELADGVDMLDILGEALLDRGPTWSESSSPPYDDPRDLTELAIDLLFLCAGSDEIVAELSFNASFVVARRGSGPLDPHTFRLERPSATG